MKFHVPELDIFETDSQLTLLIECFIASMRERQILVNFDETFPFVRALELCLND